jgi:hypothetical protein
LSTPNSGGTITPLLSEEGAPAEEEAEEDAATPDAARDGDGDGEGEETCAAGASAAGAAEDFGERNAARLVCLGPTLTRVCSVLRRRVAHRRTSVCTTTAHASPPSRMSSHSCNIRTRRGRTHTRAKTRETMRKKHAHN